MTRTDTCGRLALALAHDIYTPTRQTQDAGAGRRERPYAGWIRASAGVRRVSPSVVEEREVTIGWVGPGALGRELQQYFHDLAPRFNRSRTGWGEQLPNTPTVDVAWGRSGLWTRRGSRSLGADVVPHARLALGTGRTAATAGLTARVGRVLTVPWLAGTDASARDWEWQLHATGRMHAVARDATLDGPLGADPREVGHRPLVPEHEFGVLLRWRFVSAGYRAGAHGREYRDGPVSFEYGVLETTLSFPHRGRAHRP